MNTIKSKLALVTILASICALSLVACSNTSVNIRNSEELKNISSKTLAVQTIETNHMRVRGGMLVGAAIMKAMEDNNDDYIVKLNEIFAKKIASSLCHTDKSDFSLDSVKNMYVKHSGDTTGSKHRYALSAEINLRFIPCNMIYYKPTMQVNWTIFDTQNNLKIVECTTYAEADSNDEMHPDSRNPRYEQILIQLFNANVIDVSKHIPSLN